MVTDFINPKYRLFWSGLTKPIPPNACKMVTATAFTETVLDAGARLVHYLTEFVEKDDFQWHTTDSILLKGGGTHRMGPDTIILRLAYEDELVSDRVLTFYLTEEKAIVDLGREP
jgi:hypothetical protein